MYLNTFEKGLDRGKICETSEPIKAKIQIMIFGQANAYIARGLCTQSLSCVHMLMTYVRGACSKP